MNFAKFSRFFKDISGRMLLEKHWISPKTAPIAIPVNVSNTWLANRIFTFFKVCLRQTLGCFYGNFIEVFLVLYEFIYRNSFQINCLSLSSCLILKMWRLRVISVKKKYLKLSHINPSRKPSALRFFHFS